MKKFLKILFIMALTIPLFGCSKEKAVILFNKQPINTTTINTPTNLFELGETTHYVIYNPKGFKYAYLRLQVLKKDKKVQNWGYKIHVAKNLKIDTTKNYYIDEMKLSQKGFYIVSVYYLKDLVHPIVRASFEVK